MIIIESQIYLKKSMNFYDFTIKINIININRYYCNSSSIDNQYALHNFHFLIYNIPSLFVYNAEKEEQDEQVEAKKMELVVVPKGNIHKLCFPFEKKITVHS